ncbi:MAG: hypothetical protein PHR38_05400, partial [Bacteroidales bacterium]|nr:hypothetical protein [Bacteroidales bacterium]
AYYNFKMFIKIKIKCQKEIINHFMTNKMIIFVCLLKNNKYLCVEIGFDIKYKGDEIYKNAGGGE